MSTVRGRPPLFAGRISGRPAHIRRPSDRSRSASRGGAHPLTGAGARAKGDASSKALASDRRSGRIEAALILGLVEERPDITLEELRAASGHSGRPAKRSPSVYLARSSSLRRGVIFLTSEIRNAGAS
jgi:hypothetical protein